MSKSSKPSREAQERARVSDAPVRSQRESLRIEIRDLGLRATPARISTLRFLRLRGAPMTHAEVAEALQEQGFDKATVFRNLQDLTEVGLLRRAELGDHVWRFEAKHAAGEIDGGHPHFVCVDCGSVTCLERVQLTASSLRQSEGVGRVTEILLRGYCHQCQ